MSRIVTIVEGHGEVQAVPILLRRIAERQSPAVAVELPRPIRVKRQRLLKPGELERAVDLAGRQCGTDGAILILLDADRDCPKELASEILDRARRARGDRKIRVVLAKTEYESWLLAAMDSIAGHRGIASTATAPPDPESLPDAKGLVSRQMPAGRSYRETLDQPALTAIFDLELARRSPSFDKLWRDVTSLLVGPL